MAELKYAEFTEEPSVYTICSNTQSSTGVSCIIVEDDPGPYLNFLSEIVSSLSYHIVMTAPFAASTLRLLKGEEVIFGQGRMAPKVRIPDLSRCVVILDMRNETPQSFPGYEPKQFDMAGYQFFKQLRGFPGKVFFATRYGRAKFEEMGIHGPFGVIPLAIKAGYHGALMDADKQKIMAALDNALILCDVSSVYRIVRRGDVIDITYGGEVASIMPGKEGPSRPALAFMAVVQAGPKGLKDEELSMRLDYEPRGKEPAMSSDSVSDTVECSPEMTADDLLARLIKIVKEGGVDGVGYADIAESCESGVAGGGSESIIREVFSLCCEKNPNFTQADLLDLLKGGFRAPESTNELDFKDWAAMSVANITGSGDAISPNDKVRGIKNYVELHYKEIPCHQALIKEREAALLQREAELLRRVVRSTEDGKRQEAVLQKKALGDLGVERQKIRDLREHVVLLGRLRDAYFRIGLLSKPQRNDEGHITGYLVASEVTKVSDAMRQYPKRLVQNLRKQCKPVPDSLVKHIEQHWVRDKGVNCYTGDKVWKVG